MTIWTFDPQLRRRCLALTEFDYFTLAKSRAAWKSIALHIQNATGLEFPHGAGDDYFRRLFAATHGSIGLLAKLTFESAASALRKGEKEVTYATLSETLQIHFSAQDSELVAFSCGADTAEEFDHSPWLTLMPTLQSPDLGSVLSKR